ncbi:MAG: hypothetical protein AAGD32_11010 [Planctomycetota bacterium]
MSLTLTPKKSLLTLAAGVTAAFITAPALAEIEEHIPEDAVMVVRFNDLTETSAKLGKLFQDLGITGFDPQLEDPLGAMQQQMGVNDGLDGEGDAAFVVLPFDRSPEDSAFILMPVTDYAAFLGNFGSDEVDGIAEVRPEQGGRLWVMKVNDDYAALTGAEGVLEDVEFGGFESGGLSGEAFNGQDAILYANFSKIGELVLPELEEGKAEIMQEMQDELRDSDEAKYEPIAEAAINQFFTLAETFLSETNATTLGVSFGETGINFQVIADFEEDSYIGDTVGSMGGSDASLLAGLPEMNYFMFGGGIGDPEVGLEVMEDIFGPIVEATEGVEQDEWTKIGLDYYSGLVDIVAATEGSSFGVIVPQGDLGVDPLVQYVSISYGDGEKIMAATTKMQSIGQDLMQQIGVIAGGNAQMPEITYKQNAKTIAGVQLDSITQAPTPGGPETMIFGPDGMVQYFGVADGSMIQFSGLSDADAETFINAVKAGGDPLVDAPGVAGVSDQLPDERVAVMYFRLDELVRTVGDTAQQFGMPVQVNMPPDLAPLGVAVSSDDSALIIDGFLPSDTLQALVAQGMQTFMQMQGGGRGAGGGL